MNEPEPSHVDSMLRPRRSPEAELHRRCESDREIFVLKHRSLHVYQRLSGLSLFLWSRLDGERSISELGRLVVHAGGPRDESKVHEAIQRLVSRGFVAFPEGHLPQLRDAGLGIPMKPWQRLAARTVAILTWRHAWRQADAVVARIYRGCGNVLLQPVSLAMFFLIGLAGLAVFAWQLLHGWYGAAAAAPLGPSQVVTLVLLVWGSGCLHELGHAIAVKHFGREVISIGYGWYWLGPCFFVDTSDMWIAPRNARIAVSLAGPCVDFLFAGLAAISCFLLPPSCAPYAFVFSVDRYIAMGFNLCPLMEGDGYCILMDVSGKENLRSRAFDLLINRLPCSAWKLSFLKQNRTELLYSAGSIFYLVAMGALSISAWRNVVAHWLERAMSPWAAAALGWTLAALLGSSLAMGLIGELHQHFKRTAEAA